MFGLEVVGQVKKYLELLDYIQALDADKDGVKDLPEEYLLKLTRLREQVAAVHGTCAELADLMGDDLDAIKAKLGI